ncbi:MAG: hypothetical protein WCC04_22380 [Terriglobales bacterium]
MIQAGCSLLRRMWKSVRFSHKGQAAAAVGAAARSWESEATLPLQAASIPLLLSLMILVATGCSLSGSEFVGKWVNVKNSNDVMEITRNGEQFLIGERNEKIGATYKDGSLEVSGMMGSVRLTYVKSSDTLLAPGMFDQSEYKRAQTSSRAVADQTRKAEKAAVPSSEYPFAGFWKTQCSDTSGLAIAPAGDGYYSISFCGPGGCFEPGTYRPNSRIANDPNYHIINNDEIEVSGKGGAVEKCAALSRSEPCEH